MKICTTELNLTLLDDGTDYFALYPFPIRQIVIKKGKSHEVISEFKIDIVIKWISENYSGSLLNNNVPCRKSSNNAFQNKKRIVNLDQLYLSLNHNVRSFKS